MGNPIVDYLLKTAGLPTDQEKTYGTTYDNPDPNVNPEQDTLNAGRQYSDPLDWMQSKGRDVYNTIKSGASDPIALAAGLSPVIEESGKDIGKGIENTAKNLWEKAKAGRDARDKLLEKNPVLDRVVSQAAGPLGYSDPVTMVENAPNVIADFFGPPLYVTVRDRKERGEEVHPVEQALADMSMAADAIPMDMGIAGHAATPLAKGAPKIIEEGLSNAAAVPAVGAWLADVLKGGTKIKGAVAAGGDVDDVLKTLQAAHPWGARFPDSPLAKELVKGSMTNPINMATYAKGKMNSGDRVIAAISDPEEAAKGFGKLTLDNITGKNAELVTDFDKRAMEQGLQPIGRIIEKSSGRNVNNANNLAVVVGQLPYEEARIAQEYENMPGYTEYLYKRQGPTKISASEIVNTQYMLPKNTMDNVNNSAVHEMAHTYTKDFMSSVFTDSKNTNKLNMSSLEAAYKNDLEKEFMAKGATYDDVDMLLKVDPYPHKDEEIVSNFVASMIMQGPQYVADHYPKTASTMLEFVAASKTHNPQWTQFASELAMELQAAGVKVTNPNRPINWISPNPYNISAAKKVP